MISYRIKTSARARHMRISVYPDGAVVVTRPLRLPQDMVAQFVQSKLHWIADKLKRFSRRKPIIDVQFGSYHDSRERARAFLLERLAHFGALYGVAPKGVSIKNQKSLWGSCSHKGNLNFNYRVLYLPAHLADYIVVHELCHLTEPNHSRKFWALVSQTFPDYKAHRREMKKYSTRGFRHI